MLVSPPKHVQDWLDRRYAGMRCEWNPRLGRWFITDYTYFDDGMVARDVFFAKPDPMRALDNRIGTNRTTLFVLEDWFTRETVPPNIEGIQRQLARGFTGGFVENANKVMDRVEGIEQDEERKARKAVRDYAVDVAKEAWSDAEGKRSSFGPMGTVTHWHRRHEDAREMAKQIAEDPIQEDLKEMVREGKYVERKPLTFKEK